MTTTARVTLALIASTGFWTIPAVADEPAFDAKAAFARLKSLEGEWKVARPKAEHGEKATHESKDIFKVTAAGSAVMETQAIGTNHEMVTMYHLDGNELLVTHYCAAGNQPRMKLDLKASNPDSLSFVFDGGTNFDPAKDMHIHALKIHFLEKGKVESEWEAWMDGKKAEIVKIPMSR